MENTTDILDDLVNLDFNEEEQKKLDEKFKPQTQVDINEPFYKASKISTIIVQTLSVILGFGLCIHMTEKFPDFKEFIFLSCVGLLALWELFKRTALSKIQEIRIKNKYKKVKLKATPYKIASFILVTGSMCVGFFGAEHVIKKFSKHQQLEDLEELRETYFLQISEVQEEFLSASLGQRIEEVAEGMKYKYGRKKGEVKSASASLLRELQKGEAQNQEAKNKAVNDLRSEMVQALNQAEEENKAIVAEHHNWCSSFGWYASIMNILCDILLIVLLRWCFNHEDNKRKLNKKKKELQESIQGKEKEPFQEPVKKKEPELQEVKEQEQEKAPIGFAKKEGSLTTKEGKKAVLVAITKGKNKGKLVAKTEKELINNINSQSNPTSERTIHLKNLLEKLS